MIHTASLVHDDVLDECNIRRGEQQYTEHTTARHHLIVS